MNADVTTFTTGLPGLDQMLQGLRPGDNVVWQVDTIDDYLPFVRPFWEAARKQGRSLTYFRFARHRELIGPDQGGTVYRLRPEVGFEKYLTEILDIIERNGKGACYVFDWLSDLAADWYSDRMLGNFFLIACPYLYDLDTIAYFALRKHQHSFHATDGISRTAQVILEVYRKKNQLFIHPQKVWQRYSPTMYMLHSWEGAEFRPVTSSALTTEILASVPQPWLDFSIHRLGVWTRTFRQAQGTLNAIKNRKKSAAEAEAFFYRICRMVVSRDQRFIRLVRQYLDLADLIEIMKRMIGTGLIGGKTLGMLLARAILKKTDPRWAELLEVHDSFFVGTDVFYTYLVQNGCWWLRRRQKDFNLFLERAGEARQKMLEGIFPQYIQDQFSEMLEYFGQSPIIVRSSSLLEDNYGNAFSGKYESVFCASQGTPQQRLEAFMAAVRTVYASTMSPEGLLYRRHHGLLDQDEQMALLVQRVSGEMHGNQFFPQVAGVGFSFNPFVWHEDIDPQSGFLRLVFGLGTRAVDRTEDDYPRLVALNAPQKRLESQPNDVRQYSQKRVDVLDLQANQLLTCDVETAAQHLPPSVWEMFAEWDENYVSQMRAMNRPPGFSWVLGFERLLSQTNFPSDLRAMLRILQEAYDHPVDIEFTVNFFLDGTYRINLVQCRPFQVKILGEGSRVKFPSAVPAERLLLTSRGPIVGHSLATRIDRLVCVVPAVYGQMSVSQRYSVARAIGRVTHQAMDHGKTLMLMGPGRWGTSMPSLGVPVSFAEIETVSVLCEIALMREGLIPDVSLGTHFFNDLVEMDMLYLAVSPEKDGHVLNLELLSQAPNRLAELWPEDREWADAIRVIEFQRSDAGGGFFLNVNSLKQMAIGYLETV